MPWRTKDPDVVWTDLEDGGILLHMRTKRYYSLNAVGQSIWKLLDDTESPLDLVRGVTMEYAVDATRARESVARFLLELDHARLLEPHPPTPLVAEASGAGSSVRADPGTAPLQRARGAHARRAASRRGDESIRSATAAGGVTADPVIERIQGFVIRVHCEGPAIRHCAMKSSSPLREAR